jgi:putative phage-type endonuclease
VTDAERAAWLARRARGIGGSDIGAICGLDPFRTPFDVWREKRAALDGEPIEDAAGEAAEWGLAIEPLIVQAFEARTGFAAAEYAGVLPAPGPWGSWHLASPDRVTRGASTPRGEWDGVLEAKLRSRGDRWGPSDTDRVPPETRAQVAWYQAALGAQTGAVAALIGGTDLRVYWLDRDPALEDVLRRAGAAFWALVESGERPPLVARDNRHAMSDWAREVLGVPELIQVPDELEDWPERYAAAVAWRKEADAEVERLQAEAKAAMIARRADSIDGVCTFRASKKGVRSFRFTHKGDRGK